MSDIDPSHAPGCFASALMCRPGTVECDSCVFVTACEPLSCVKRQALYDKFGVKAKTSRRSRAEPASQPISDQAQGIVERIEKSGLAVATTLRSGVNPFMRPLNLRVACHLLLKMPTGVEREMLRAAFVQKLALDRETARAQADTTIEVLSALGAAHAIDDRFILRRAS